MAMPSHSLEFDLASRVHDIGSSRQCRIQLETQIALQFEHATLRDLLLPSKKEHDGSSVFRIELDSMERILKLFLTRFRGYDDARVGDMPMLSGVAKLWDEYLAEIAFDSSITPARFSDLVDRIPAYMRVVHDHAYRAIHTYLKVIGVAFIFRNQKTRKGAIASILVVPCLM